MKTQGMKRVRIGLLILMLFMTMGLPGYADDMRIDMNDVVSQATAMVYAQVGKLEPNDTLTLLPQYIPSQEVLVPEGSSVSYNLSLPYGVRFNAPTVAYATITADGRPYAKITMKFDVKLYRNVVVVSRVMTPGEILSPDTVMYESMDVGRLNAGYLTDSSKVIGMMVRRQLPARAVLNLYMLGQPEVIKKGSLVTLLVRVGSMEVSASCKALQDGRVGQVIRVQNMSSKKFLSGTVVDESTVLING